MTLLEVDQRTRLQQDFLNVVTAIYQNNTTWVRPLNKDLNAVFTPSHNSFFQRGELKRWVLYDKGRPIGRIAAFYDSVTARIATNLQQTGGIGFFECINDKAAAHVLFDTAKQWLAEKGMEAMDGPINFGERHKWWGLLVDAFERSPNFQCNYHPPYYRNLFESYGFQVYFKQYTYSISRTAVIPEDMRKRAERILSNSKYTVEYRKKHEIDRMAEEITYIYNKAWANRKDVASTTETDARNLLKTMRPLMDSKLLWFAYYDKQPVAMYLSIPDVNQIIRPLNGKLSLLNKLWFLYRAKTHVCTKAIGLVFGIVPRFQGRGIADALIIATGKVHQGGYDRYLHYEMNWIGDFHPAMQHVVEALGATRLKTHCTYRKLFDSTQPFHNFAEAQEKLKDKL